MVEVKIIEHVEAEQIYPLIKQLDDEKTCEYIQNCLKQMLGKNYFIVGAYKDETLVGITGCWIATKFYCGKYLEIDNFVVDENFRNQGIGSKIFDFVFDYAKKSNCDSVMLDVYSWNEGAHRFYDRYNLKHLGSHMVATL